VYRAVQEALTNCVRHASASSIRVMVNGSEESIRVTVADDGIGFDAARRRNGLGLRGIFERVKELGGQFRIDGAPGHGTRLDIELPMPAAIPKGYHARAAR
jgi:two-component system NarL family sensor kinase